MGRLLAGLGHDDGVLLGVEALEDGGVAVELVSEDEDQAA